MLVAAQGGRNKGGSSSSSNSSSCGYWVVGGAILTRTANWLTAHVRQVPCNFLDILFCKTKGATCSQAGGLCTHFMKLCKRRENACIAAYNVY